MIMRKFGTAHTHTLCMCAKWLTKQALGEGYDLRALAVTVQKLKKHRTAHIVRSRLLSRVPIWVKKDLQFCPSCLPFG